MQNNGLLGYFGWFLAIILHTLGVQVYIYIYVFIYLFRETIWYLICGNLR